MLSFPQCTSCQSKTIAKMAKRKQVAASDVVKKKQETLLSDITQVKLPKSVPCPFRNVPSFLVFGMCLFLLVFA